jgi:hypothetical protein
MRVLLTILMLSLVMSVSGHDPLGIAVSLVGVFIWILLDRRLHDSG